MIQGEIWQVNLDPNVGDEMQKSRPCIILNNNAMGKLALKIIAPITDFKEIYRSVPWMVIVEPTKLNGLKKISAIDIFQLRSLSHERVARRIGEVDKSILSSCKEAIKIVFE